MQEPLAVVGDAREVAVPPHVGPARPVRLEVALAVVPQAAGHARPRLRAHELADRAAHRPAVVVEHVDRHAERGPAERARRERLHDVRRQEARADLGAARDVDDRAAAAADDVEVPAPRRFVPRLAGRREDAQRRQVVRAHRFVAVRHQRAHERRRHAEDRDAMPLDERPQPVGTRVVGRAVVEHERAAVRERADDLPRPHDPADVGEPEQPLAGPQVHLERDLLGDLDEEAAVHVHRALRAGRSCRSCTRRTAGARCRPRPRRSDRLPVRRARRA